MKKVVVLGSINVDTTLYVNEFPSKGETISGNSSEIDVGGKGFNQAIAIKKAGIPVSFISAVGSDSNGQLICDTAHEYKLTSYFYKADVQTGTAYILVNKNSENKIVVIPGSNDYVRKDTINKYFLDEADIIVLQNEIPMETNEYVFEKYKHKTIVYNPSPLKRLKEEYYSSISYLIVNEHEVSYFGKGKDYLSQGRDILSKGVKNVIVTLGENGSVLMSNSNNIKVNAIKVNAIDTVAAGDTYLGYFVSGLAKGLDEAHAMMLASKASAITVTRKGAIKAIPSIEEIK